MKIRVDKVRQYHCDTYSYEKHGKIGVRGVYIIRLFTIFDSSNDGCYTQKSVDIQHDGGIDRISGKYSRTCMHHHDHDDDDLHNNCRNGQDKCPVRLSEFLSQHLCMVGNRDS